MFLERGRYPLTRSHDIIPANVSKTPEKMMIAGMVLHPRSRLALLGQATRAAWIKKWPCRTIRAGIGGS